MFKRDLRDNYPNRIFTASQDELVRYHVSSGTTGKPTVVGYTHPVRSRTASSICRPSHSTTPRRTSSWPRGRPRESSNSSRTACRSSLDLRPDCFEDIVAAVALYRPGPMGAGMHEEHFVRGEHSLAQPLAHPSSRRRRRPTYGVIVYQEQVMEIAQMTLY